MRRRSRPLFLALFASLAVTSVAIAGGWAQVTVTDLPADPVADGETTIGLVVMQHGMTAVSWPTLTVVATDAGSGAIVRTDARPAGPTGSYVATIRFPAAGDWTLMFESNDLSMEGGAVVRIASPAAPAAAPSAPSTTVPTGSAALTVVLGALALGVLVLAALTIRGRRGGRPEPSVSVRG